MTLTGEVLRVFRLAAFWGEAELPRDPPPLSGIPGDVARLVRLLACTLELRVSSWVACTLELEIVSLACARAAGKDCMGALSSDSRMRNHDAAPCDDNAPCIYMYICNVYLYIYVYVH